MPFEPAFIPTVYPDSRKKSKDCPNCWALLTTYDLPNQGPRCGVISPAKMLGTSSSESCTTFLLESMHPHFW